MVTLGVRSANGPFDVIYVSDGNAMGFITRTPSGSRQVSSFAQRIAAGGSSQYSNEAFDQLVLPGFDGGGDRLLFETGDRRYQETDGRVALATEDIVTLASQWRDGDTATATAREIIDFDSTTGGPWICVATGTKLRVYNTTTGVWSDAGTFAAPAISIFSDSQYLFVACGAGDDIWRWDGTTTTTNWTKPATGQKANCFAYYGQRLYRAYGRSIAHSTNAGGTWTAAADVGWPNTSITDLYVAGGYLVICKPEGPFLFDGTNVYSYFDASTTYSTTNFRGGCEWQGALFLPWLNAIHKCVISSTSASRASGSVTDITPRMKGSTAKEVYGHGLPIRIFAGPRRLYVAFHAGEGVYPELLSYNGVGWHQVYRGGSGDTMRAAGYSRLMGWLLINDGRTRYKRVINAGDTEYPDYAASGSFVTPGLDGGLPDEVKAWRSIALKVRDCDADNTVAVQYRTDGGSWVDVDTIRSTPSNPEAFIELLLGGVDTQVSAKKIEFKISLARTPGDATKTPVIKMPIIVRVLPVPPPIDAYSDALVLDTNTPLRNGFGRVGDFYTLAEMRDFIDAMRVSPSTITRIDEQGYVTRVKITDYAEQAIRSEDGQERVVGGLRLLDVQSGPSRQVDIGAVATISVSGSLFTWSGSSAYGVRRWGAFAYGV